jgi:hypothetical protein
MKRINYLQIYFTIRNKWYSKRWYYFKLFYFGIFILLLIWFLIQFYNTTPEQTGYSFIDKMSEEELHFFVKHLEEIIRRYK